MKTIVGFDYEILHRCQYPILVKGGLETEADCGEPAPYRVFWFHEDGTDAGEMFVCQEHFKFIAAVEVSEDATWESLGRGFIEHEPDQTYGAAD